MQFENPDKPANANTDVITVSDLGNDWLNHKQDVAKLTPGTQEAALPEGNTVIKPDLGGLIKDITFPGPWTKMHQDPEPHGFQTELYSFNENKDVFMSYKYRGGTSYITAEEICKVMKEPDHKLSQAEIEQVRKGFDNDQGLPEDFDLKKAWTQTINGRRVLFVEGAYKQEPAKGRNAITAYIDSDPSRPGRLPESVTYFAMKDQNNFPRYLPLAMKAFESMQFKTHVATSNPM